MAANQTVPHPPSSRKSHVSKQGVLTLSGFGVRVRIQNGHLEIEDGVGLERRKLRLPRVNHGLKRLVCISDDGYATLSALKWLGDVGASFVLVDRNGRTLLVTGPTAPSDARLKRSQALALSNGLGLEISRALIQSKLEAHERVLLEQLRDEATARTVAQLREKLSTADTFDKIRILEAHAAGAYFSAWHNIPVLWPKQDARRIPDHWRQAGSRRSPLTGGPRLAVTPVQAILNFSFALLESETRICICALGLDPGLGLGLHTDAPSRDSLVFDVLEPVRADVECWVLNWIRREPLRKADFFETATGNCRLRSKLCSKLSETAPTWGKLVAPWAEYVARALWTMASGSRRRRSLPTPLTQQHRREAKGQPPFPAIAAPKVGCVCRGCGATVAKGRRYCRVCAKATTLENFSAGRSIAQRPDSLAKRSATQRQHKLAIRNWKPSDLPGWLTPDLYAKQIQPTLATVATARISSRLGVSEPYAGRIRHGYRPHPRHWQALAALVGISFDLQVRDV